MSRISKKLQDKVRRDAKDRCGYCRSPQMLIPIPFEMEHILPKAKGGESEEGNLWLACRFCNSFKHAKTHAIDPQTNAETELFNPRKQVWDEQFGFRQDQTEIVGKTACGRATVVALKLNSELSIAARRIWVSVGLFPSKD